MISYEGWDREYKENREAYLELFDKFMSQLNYENNEKFEKEFAEKIGRKHAVSVGSATDALHFILLANGIGPSDEVLVTDFSWISSASCVNMIGATPVFCDIDIDSYHISFDSIKRMYTKKTKALIYVHLFGNMVDTTEIIDFCKEKNILFIEDAAQSLGSSLYGVKAGTIGDCSVYSFNSNKVIAGINGGGIVLTDEDYIASQIKMIRRHGKNNEFEQLGFNSRMYVLNAEIINLRLQNLESTQLIRQKIASKYNEAFATLPIITQKSPNGLNHNYHKYTLRFENKETRDRVRKALKASVHYELPLSENKMFDADKYRKDVCMNSKLVSETILSLPVHAWLTEEEISFIIQIVKGSIRE